MISRYRPGSTGHRDDPSEVIRASITTGSRWKVPGSADVVLMTAR